MKSNLDIVKECDNFPYNEPGSSEEYQKQLSSLWLFFLPEDPMPHGFILDSVVKKMPWTANFKIISSPRREVHLLRNDNEYWQKDSTQAIDTLLDQAIMNKSFPGFDRKRDEPWPIVGASFDINIDRSGISYFGIIGRGVHMTAFTHTSTGYKFWIPQRNPTKKTYPGMLDNTVAGGIAAGETPFECLLREADEEAEMAELVRTNAKAAGTISWFNISDEKTGGDPGLMNPGVLYVYDLEVGEDLVLKPVDNDIHAFHLFGEEKVRDALAKGRFKPSCACVILDFFVRHGLISQETEKDYVEIVSRLHRKLPFKMSR